MIKNIPFYALISCLLILTSCQGQVKLELPKNTTQQAKPTEHISSEVDPYFVATKAITSPHGPSSITRNIIEDRQGNIWLATWEGILRYDGTTFTNFTNKEGLRRFHAFAALEDSKGHLWFGTIGAGLYLYDGKSFTNFTTKEGLVHDGIGCIYEDKAGNIWVGTQDGLSCYDGTSFRNFTTQDGLTSNDINSIIEDQDGKFWIGTRGQACVFDGKTFTAFTNDAGKSFNNVRSIIKDQKGHIWLGGNDGLWRYDGKQWTNYTKNFVGYVYEDSKGSIWTSSMANSSATDWALSRYDEQPLPLGNLVATEIKTEENMFFGIVEDKEGGIWWGHLNGVCRYDGEEIDCFRNGGTRK